MRMRIPGMCLLALTFFFSTPATAAEPQPAPTQAKPEALDATLRPERREGVADIYKDMGVVQRKAMSKSGRFLFSTYGSFDFSDGPYTLYSVNVNPGYAISDFWEIYANVAPVFFSSPRRIVDEVSGLKLPNGQQAAIISPKPKLQYGGELLWAPMYGKDSFGLHSIVRSDTFLKLGVSQIQYEEGDGMRYVLGLGKTFFLGSSVGLRLTVDGGYVQTILNGDKSFSLMALIETGLVIYL